MNVNARMTTFVFFHEPMSLVMDITIGWRGWLSCCRWNIGQSILFAPFIDLSSFCYYEYVFGYGLIGVLFLSYFEAFANRMSTC
jgi:hypothetical protein